MPTPTRDGKPALPNGDSTGAICDEFLRALPHATPPTTLGPKSFSLTVTHIAQVQRWDCGLACVAMVLSLYGPPHSLEDLHRLCGTTSVWSIDLAHLLRRCGVPAPVLFTIYPGVRPDYEKEGFYAPHMAADKDRVTSLFEAAAAASVSVMRAPLTTAQLRWAVGTGSYVVIVLVDKTVLMAPGPIESLPRSPYTGHYVLLHGYDAAGDEYLIKDPAAPAVERVTAARLEAARKAHGTDEDLVFVAVPGGGGGSGGDSGGRAFTVSV